MSSPVHHPKDLDDALKYAPPWARRPRRLEVVHDAATADENAAEPNNRDDYVDPEFAGDLAILELRRRLSLDPEILPEPPLPLESGVVRFGRLMLRLGVVSSAAAFAAWAVTSWPATKPAVSEAASGIVQASDEQPAFPRRVRLEHLQIPATSSPAVHRTLLVEAEQQPGLMDKLPMAAVHSSSPQPAPVAAPQAAPPVAAAPEQSAEPAPASVTPAPASLTLTADEIETLIKRGKDYLANGDFSSARLLLRRAAEGGSAEGALTLAATFDPVVIQKLAAIGAEPDVVQARSWYQRARQLGSDAATGHLAALAQAGQ